MTLWISWPKASEVRGPVATMVRPFFGKRVTSPRTISTFSMSSMTEVTLLENTSRSTAKEPPAGTLASFATVRMIESNNSISPLRTPGPFSKDSDLKELLQTTSAKKGDVSRRIRVGFHLIENDAPSPLRNLPDRLASRQSGANDSNGIHCPVFNLLHSFCRNGAPSRNKDIQLKLEERRIKIERQPPISRFLIRRPGIHILSGDIVSQLRPFPAFQSDRDDHTEDIFQEWVYPIRQTCSGDSWCNCKRFSLSASFAQQSCRRILPGGIGPLSQAAA